MKTKTPKEKTDVIILAAGYATRLYPLTLNKPKPLIPIAGKPLVEHVLQNLEPMDQIGNVFLVSNKKFADHFHDWKKNHPTHSVNDKLIIIDNGSTDDTNKKGAIGDLYWTISQHKISNDIVVVAGDNLFNHNLLQLIDKGRESRQPILGIYDVKTKNEAKRYGVISVNKKGILTEFIEKPDKPKCTLVGICLYYYPKHTFDLMKQYIKEGNNPDQPGRLVQWLYPRVPFYTWEVKAPWYDIGSHETLAEAEKVFSKLLGLLKK